MICIQMKISEIKEWLGDDWKRFAEGLDRALASDTEMLSAINRRILDNAGKQLRPMISLLVARMCGTPNTVSYNCAVASELIHTATLLHDDVADNSPVRRGAPTIMSLFGPSVAVLVGDYWLSRAMELLVKSAGNDVIAAFSAALGDLAEGEILQLQKAEGGDTCREDYVRIITCKTASLFRASAVAAAYSVGSSADVVEAVGRYAVDLGLAFQMRDDIFDYTPQMNVGKNLGVDILERKITLPLIEALERAEPQECARIRSVVADMTPQGDGRDEVLAFVEKYDGVGHSADTLEGYCRSAVRRLEPLRGCREKELLAELALYVGRRNV